MEASEAARLLTTLAFVVLAVAALREWWIRRAPAAGWFALSFLVIAVVAVTGDVLPDDSESTVVQAIGKATIVGLVFFPYLLYRMTGVFRPASRGLDFMAAAMTAILVVATLAIPASDLMDEDETTGVVAAYTVLLLVVWTVLSGVVAVRLWRGARNEPLLARRRMRALAAGAVGLSAGPAPRARRVPRARYPAPGTRQRGALLRRLRDAAHRPRAARGPPRGALQQRGGRAHGRDHRRGGDPRPPLKRDRRCGRSRRQPGRPRWGGDRHPRRRPRGQRGSRRRA